MRIVSTLLVALMATAAFSAHAATDTKDPIQARKAIFKEYKKTFGAMGGMIKGKTEYNQAEFAKLAAEMEALSKQPWSHFPAGSDKGGKTEARAEIWSKPAEFKKAADEHQAAFAQLTKVAQAAKTLDDVKPAFGAAQKTCKSCHDSFKKD